MRSIEISLQSDRYIYGRIYLLYFLDYMHFLVSVSENTSNIWVFPKIGIPQNGWFNKVYNGKPYFLMDDLGGKTPLFSGFTPYKYGTSAL